MYGIRTCPWAITPELRLSRDMIEPTTRNSYSVLRALLLQMPLARLRRKVVPRASSSRRSRSSKNQPYFHPSLWPSTCGEFSNYLSRALPLPLFVVYFFYLNPRALPNCPITESIRQLVSNPATEAAHIGKSTDLNVLSCHLFFGFCHCFIGFNSCCDFFCHFALRRAKYFFFKKHLVTV